MDLDGIIDHNWLLSHKKLMLVTRNGLGDSIVASGLARWMASHVETVYIPCKQQYYQSIAWMYKNHSNIIPLGLAPHSNWQTLEAICEATNTQLCRSVMGFQQRNFEPWPTACYSQYKLPYLLRYTLSPQIDPGPLSDYVYNQVVQNPRYMVIHASSSTKEGYPVDYLMHREPQELQDVQVIHTNPELSNNIWDWFKVLQNAEEIHVVDSSFFRICEQLSLDLKGKVYFHYLRAVDYIPVYDRDIKPYFVGWEWVPYPNLVWS